MTFRCQRLSGSLLLLTQPGPLGPGHPSLLPPRHINLQIVSFSVPPCLRVSVVKKTNLITASPHRLQLKIPARAGQSIQLTLKKFTGKIDMPTYEYTCAACGNNFERFESITAKPNKECPKCKKKKAERRISGGGGFIFKGSGFYITDYKKTSAPANADGSKPAETGKPAEPAKAGESSKPGDTPKPAESPKTESKSAPTGSGGSGDSGSSGKSGGKSESSKSKGKVA